MAKKDLTMKLAAGVNLKEVCVVIGTVDLKRGERVDLDTCVRIDRVYDKKGCLPGYYQTNPKIYSVRHIHSLLAMAGSDLYSGVGCKISWETKPKPARRTV